MKGTRDFSLEIKRLRKVTHDAFKYLSSYSIEEIIDSTYSIHLSEPIGMHFLKF